MPAPDAQCETNASMRTLGGRIENDAIASPSTPKTPVIRVSAPSADRYTQICERMRDAIKGLAVVHQDPDSDAKSSESIGTQQPQKIDPVELVCNAFHAPPEISPTGSPERIPFHTAIELLRVCVDGIEASGGILSDSPQRVEKLISVMIVVVFNDLKSVQCSPVYVNLPQRILKLCNAFVMATSFAPGVKKASTSGQKNRGFRPLDSENFSGLIRVFFETIRNGRMAPADRKMPDRKVARKPGDDGVGGQPVAKSVSEISVQKMAQILHTLARRVLQSEGTLDIASAKMGVVVIEASFYCSPATEHLRYLVELTVYLLRHVRRDWDVLFVSLAKAIVFWMGPSDAQLGSSTVSPPMVNHSSPLDTTDGMSPRRLFRRILMNHLVLYFKPRASESPMDRLHSLLCVFFGTHNVRSVVSPGVVFYQYYLFHVCINGCVTELVRLGASSVPSPVLNAIMHVSWSPFTDPRLSADERIYCIKRSRIMREVLEPVVSDPHTSVMFSAYTWSSMIRTICANRQEVRGGELDRVVDSGAKHICKLLDCIREMNVPPKSPLVNSIHVLFGELVQLMVSMDWTGYPKSGVSVGVARSVSVASILQKILSVRDNEPSGETWVTIVLRNDMDRAQDSTQIRYLVRFWESIVAHDESMPSDKKRMFDGRTFGARHAILGITPTVVYNRSITSSVPLQGRVAPSPDWGYVLAATLFSRVSLISRSKTRCAQIFARTAPSICASVLQCIEIVDLTRQVGSSVDLQNEWVDFTLHTIRCFVRAASKAFQGSYTVSQPSTWADARRAFPQCDAAQGIHELIFEGGPPSRSTRSHKLMRCTDDMSGVIECLRSMADCISRAFGLWSSEGMKNHRSHGRGRIWRYMALQFSEALSVITGASYGSHPYLVKPVLELVGMIMEMSIASEFFRTIRTLIYIVRVVGCNRLSFTAAAVSDVCRTRMYEESRSYTESSVWKRIVSLLLLVGSQDTRCSGVSPDIRGLCMDTVATIFRVRGVTPALREFSQAGKVNVYGVSCSTVMRLTASESDPWPSILDVSDVRSWSGGTADRFILPAFLRWHGSGARLSSMVVVCQAMTAHSRSMEVKGFSPSRLFLNRVRLMAVLAVSFARGCLFADSCVRPLVEKMLVEMVSRLPDVMVPVVLGVDSVFGTMVPGYGPLSVSHLVYLFDTLQNPRSVAVQTAWVDTITLCASMVGTQPSAFVTSVEFIRRIREKNERFVRSLDAIIKRVWKKIHRTYASVSRVRLPKLHGENATASWPVCDTRDASVRVDFVYRYGIHSGYISLNTLNGEGTSPKADLTVSRSSPASDEASNTALLALGRGFHAMIITNRTTPALVPGRMGGLTDAQPRSPIPHEAFPFPKMTIQDTASRLRKLLGRREPHDVQKLVSMATSEAIGDVCRLASLLVLTEFVDDPGDLDSNNILRILFDFVRVRARRFRNRLAWGSASEQSKSGVLMRLVRGVYDKLRRTSRGQSHFVKEAMDCLAQTRYNSTECGAVLHFIILPRMGIFATGRLDIFRRMYYLSALLIHTNCANHQGFVDDLISACLADNFCKAEWVHQCMTLLFPRLLRGSDRFKDWVSGTRSNAVGLRTLSTDRWVDRVVLGLSVSADRYRSVTASAFDCLSATRRLLESFACTERPVDALQLQPFYSASRRLDVSNGRGEPRRKKRRRTKTSGPGKGEQSSLEPADVIGSKPVDHIRPDPQKDCEEHNEVPVGHLHYIYRSEMWIRSTEAVMGTFSSGELQYSGRQLMHRLSEFVSRLCAVPVLVCTTLKFDWVCDTLTSVFRIEQHILESCERGETRGWISPSSVALFYVGAVGGNIKMPSPGSHNGTRYSDSRYPALASTYASRVAALLWKVFIDGASGGEAGRSYKCLGMTRDSIHISMSNVLFDILVSGRSDSDVSSFSKHDTMCTELALFYSWECAVAKCSMLRVFEQVSGLCVKNDGSASPGRLGTITSSIRIWEVLLDVLVLDSPNGSSIRLSTLFKDRASMCEWVHTSVPVASARCLPKFFCKLANLATAALHAFRVCHDGPTDTKSSRSLRIHLKESGALRLAISILTHVAGSALSEKIEFIRLQDAVLDRIYKYPALTHADGTLSVWSVCASVLGLPWKSILTKSFRDRGLLSGSVIPILCAVSLHGYNVPLRVTRPLFRLAMQLPNVSRVLWSTLYRFDVSRVRVGDRICVQNITLGLIDVIGDHDDARALLSSYLQVESVSNSIGSYTFSGVESLGSGSIRTLMDRSCRLNLAYEAGIVLRAAATRVASTEIDSDGYLSDSSSRTIFQQILYHASQLFEDAGDVCTALGCLASIFMKENSPVQEAVSLLSVGSDDLALEVLSGFIVKTAQEAARKCGIPGYVDPVESIAAMRIMRIAALRLGDYAVESRILQKSRGASSRLGDLVQADGVRMRVAEWGASSKQVRLFQVIKKRSRDGTRSLIRTSPVRTFVLSKSVSSVSPSSIQLIQMIKEAQVYLRVMFIDFENVSPRWPLELISTNLEYCTRSVQKTLECVLYGRSSGVPAPGSQSIITYHGSGLSIRSPRSAWTRVCVESCLADVRALANCIRDIRSTRNDAKRDRVLSRFIHRIGGVAGGSVIHDIDGYWPYSELSLLVSMGRRVILNGVLRNRKIFRIRPSVEMQGSTRRSMAATLLADTLEVRGPPDKNRDLIFTRHGALQLGMDYSALRSYSSFGAGSVWGPRVLECMSLGIIRSCMKLPGRCTHTLKSAIGSFSHAGSTDTTAPGIRERVRYLYGCSEGGVKILHDVPGLTSSCVLEGSLVLPASEIFQAVIQKHLSPEEVCMGIALLLRAAEASLGFLGSSDLDNSRGVGHLVLSSLQYASIGLFCRGQSSIRPFDGSTESDHTLPELSVLHFSILRGLTWIHSLILGPGDDSVDMRQSTVSALGTVVFPMLGGTPVDLLPVWNSRTLVVLELIRGVVDCVTVPVQRFDPLAASFWRVLDHLASRGPAVLRHHASSIGSLSGSSGIRSSQPLSSLSVQFENLLEPSQSECSARALHIMCEQACSRFASDDVSQVVSKRRSAWIESALLSVCSDYDLVRRCSKWDGPMTNTLDSEIHDTVRAIMRCSMSYAFVHKRARDKELRLASLCKSGLGTVIYPFPVSDVRDEITRIYSDHRPERLSDVDTLMRRYKGRETRLLLMIREKYVSTDRFDVESIMCRVLKRHVHLGTRSTDREFWLHFAEMCSGLVDFLKLMNHDIDFARMKEHMVRLRKAVAERCGTIHSSSQSFSAIYLSAARRGSSSKSVHCVDIDTGSATPHYHILGYSHPRVSCPWRRNVCRRISVTGSDGVEYTVYSQWPHSIRGYTEESDLFPICDRLSAIQSFRGGAVPVFYIALFLLGSIQWPECMKVGSTETKSLHSGFSRMHNYSVFRCIFRSLRCFIGECVPEKQLVARVLFHFIVRSKLSHRILGSVSGERALQAPYFSIAKLRDMARLSNAEMEVWARSCRDPSSDKADPDVSADQKARVEESVRAINNVLRRSWRMDSYSECKPHTSVPMPLYRSALMEAADGTVSGKPGFGGGGLGTHVSAAFHGFRRWHDWEWWDVESSRVSSPGMIIRSVKTYRVDSKVTLDWASNTAEMHGRTNVNTATAYRDRLDRSGMAILRKHFVPQDAEQGIDPAVNRISLPEYIRRETRRFSADLNGYDCTEEFTLRQRMASSAGIQTALHFLDSESNQILRSDKKGFERCPVHSVRFSPGFTVDTDSGVLRWENTHSSHDDRAFVAVVRDIVGASTLHTYAVPSAAHVLKVASRRPFEFAAVMDVDVWLRKMSHRRSRGDVSRISDWAKNVWSYRRSVAPCPQTRMNDIMDALDQSTHKDHKTGFHSKRVGINAHTLVSIARSFLF